MIFIFGLLIPKSCFGDFFLTFGLSICEPKISLGWPALRKLAFSPIWDKYCHWKYLQCVLWRFIFVVRYFHNNWSYSYRVINFQRLGMNQGVDMLTNSALSLWSGLEVFPLWILHFQNSCRKQDIITMAVSLTVPSNGTNDRPKIYLSTGPCQTDQICH